MFSTTVGRRQFIKLAGSSGVLASMPFFPNEAISSSESFAETNHRKNDLLNAIRYQNELHDWDTDPVQSDNLEYAFEKIKPVNHAEYCFVLWCGAQRCSVTHYADEFLLRRERKTPQLPDHFELAMEAMAAPDTHRILVYHEQIESLFKGWDMPSANRLRHRFIAGEIRVDEFSNFFPRHAKDRLTDEDIKVIHGALEYYAPCTLPFYWCSTIVHRAEVA